MKTFLNRLLVITYLVSSLSILILGAILPIAFGLGSSIPVWICWILYPLVLIVIASQKQCLDWADRNTY